MTVKAGAWMFAICALTMFVVIKNELSRPLTIGFTTPTSESMDEMSSKGTRLLSCIDDRIDMVCEEIGALSESCKSIRKAHHSETFDSIRSINRCLNGPDRAHCEIPPVYTLLEFRSKILRELTVAESECHTIDSDPYIQTIVDEAFRRKLVRLAEWERRERAGGR